MAQFWPHRQGLKQHGSVAASSASFTVVVFPVAFESVPMVYVTARSLSANGAPHITALSASGFSVALAAQAGTVTGTVDWVAEVV